jgi:hypothetical protein
MPTGPAHRGREGELQARWAGKAEWAIWNKKIDKME